MADRRGVRSSSRRTTPAPQPPSKATTTTRRRGTRSASRHVDAPSPPAKATRRSARQASVDSALGENEPDARALFLLRAQRKAQKEIADLTVVEEGDTYDTLASSSQPNTQTALPRRSLGAASEMSGTTAITSFTLVEAEALEPRFMLRHLVKLHEEVGEFLDHLVPADGSMHEDDRHIEQMHDPTSEFFADYNDFNQQLRARLVHYRGDDQQYIHIRAVHAALLGANRDAAQTGLDLLLYQANLIVFAKDMIPLDENDKTTEVALRDLDNLFPSLFLPALILGITAAESITGDSALLQETFELALELRTQLAIASLSRGLADEAFDPDAALDEVFFNPHSESTQLGVVRGWTTFALGGEDSALPGAFVQRVVDRMTAIREFFSTGESSQGQEEENVNLYDLSAEFPWAALMLRLVGWVRARNKELVAAIQQQGGANGIQERIKTERERSSVDPETGRIMSRSSPRRNRNSFGRNRRRSSGKFNPNAEVDTEVLSKLIAREGGARAHSPAPAIAAALQEEEVEQIALEDGEGIGSLQQNDDDSRPYQDDVESRLPRDEDDSTTNAVGPVVEHVAAAEEVAANPVEHVPVQDSEIPESSRPPKSTNDFVSLLKETRTSDKENRAISMFQRQANAQRVHFGDGFDNSQPTPGPSRSQPPAGPSRKGKEPQHLSPRKRKVAELSDDDDDDPAFGTAHHSTHVQRQRANAPKRVRIEPKSSAVPTSHQPGPRDENDGFRQIEDFQQPENDDPSEAEAPEMTEEAPPRSTFDDVRALARANTIHKPRRAKRTWTVAEEEALILYMSDCPRKYSNILLIDRASPRPYFHALENGEWIAQRSQVDLKDKARVMAKNMIKSGTGLRPGFEGVINPAMEKQLRDDGFDW